MGFFRYRPNDNLVVLADDRMQLKEMVRFLDDTVDECLIRPRKQKELNLCMVDNGYNSNVTAQVDKDVTVTIDYINFIPLNIMLRNPREVGPLSNTMYDIETNYKSYFIVPFRVMRSLQLYDWDKVREELESKMVKRYHEELMNRDISYLVH